MQISGVSRRRRIQTRLLERHEGIDFVRCRVCGDHRRVISRRHLSKHGADRETYMDEYRPQPRPTLRRGFSNANKFSAWPTIHMASAIGLLRLRRSISAMAKCLPGTFKKIIHIFTIEAFGFFVIGITVYVQRVSCRKV